MLALSRKKNEAIVINNDIEITVLEVKGDRHHRTQGSAHLPQGSLPPDPGGQQGRCGCRRHGGTEEPVGVKINKNRKRKRLRMHKSGAFIHC